MRKKGKHTSGPDPDHDFLRQKQKRIINKTKSAWMWSERPAGLCQLDNLRSRPVGLECAMGEDSLFTQAVLALRTQRSGVFPGERFEFGHLCSGSGRPRAGNSRVELGS